MPDWRDEESPRKGGSPKRKPLPVFQKNDGTPPPKSKRTDWRGKPISTSGADDQASTPWQRSASPESAPMQVSRRTVLLWILGPCLALAILSFFYWITRSKDDPIPLLVIRAAHGRPSELGTLGFRDPTSSSKEPVTKFIQPKENVLKRIQDKKNQWLDGLKESADLKEKNGVIQGGGTNEDLIAFSLHCFAACRNDEVVLIGASDEDRLFPEACDPNDAPSNLRLRDVLERIAQSTPSKSYAIVGLDLQTPVPIHNLGDLGFPKDAIENEFKKLNEDDQKKLILFLPCGNGQESLPLPRNGMTVFGATFLTGLDTLFGEKDLTLSGLDQQLQKQVSSWAMLNRKSDQTPTRIANPKTWSNIQSKKLFGRLTALPKRDTPKDGGAPTDFQERYVQLGELWKKHHSVLRPDSVSPPDDFRSLDPSQLLVLTSLESHLVLLEDAVEYDAATWDQRLKLVEDLFEDLDKATRKVSRLKEQNLQAEIEKILRRELDSSTSDDNDKKKLAEETLQSLSKRWAEIDRLAFNSRREKSYHREMSWWMKESIHTLDTDFLEAVDEFIANRFDVANAILARTTESVTKAESDLKTLNDCMSFRDEAALFLPHGLGFLARNQTLEKQETLEEQARLMADIAWEMDRIDNLLRDPKPLEKRGIEPARDFISLKKAKDWIKNRAEEWLKSEEGDAETIRNLRIAVRYPFLPIESRQKAHGILAQRFKDRDTNISASPSESTNTKEATDPANTDPASVVATAFLERLNEKKVDDKTGEYWKCVLKGDLRGSASWKLDPSNAPKTYGELYDMARRVRLIAGPLGMHSVSQPDALLDSCAQKVLDSYVAQSELHYRHLQRERLLLARWGDPAKQTKFPFEQWSASYTDGIEGLKKSILPYWDFEAGAAKDLDDRLATVSTRLREMSDYLAADIEGQSNVRMTWSPGKWSQNTDDTSVDAWSSIRPAIKIARETVVPKSDNPFDLTKEYKRPVPTESPTDSESMEVTVNFRGHVIRSRALADQVLFASSYQPDEQSKLTARIKNEKRSVVILLDCSGSMSKGDRMTNAKQAVMSLVDSFQNSVRAGQEIDVSLVIFGIFSTESELGNDGFKISVLDKKPLVYMLGENGSRFSHVAHTDFDSIKEDESTRDRWNKYLQAPFVAAGMNTPLYDAIEFACELLPPSGTRELVILSDGSNKIVDGFAPKDYIDKVKERPYYLKTLRDLKEPQSALTYQGPNRNCGDAINRVKNSGVNLYFYQVRDTQDSDKESQLFVDSLRAIQDKKLLKTPFERSYDTFLEIKKQIEADFALPKLRLHYENLEDGRDLEVSFLEPAPTPIRPTRIALSVVRNRRENQREELTKNPLELQAYGGQHVRVEFDARTAELAFVPSKDLMEDNRFNAVLTPKTDLRNSDEFRMKWDFQKNEASTDNAYDLTIDLRRPKDKTPPEYLPWPRFAVGKLNRRMPPEETETNASPILFSDLRFESKHYPNLLLRIEKLSDPGWKSSEKNLDLWWSFEDANNLFGTNNEVRTTVPVDRRESEFRDCKIVRDGRTITVERVLQLGQEKHLWVICPDARKSDRTYQTRADQKNQWSERHAFELPDESSSKEVPLYILSEADLENDSQAPNSNGPRLYWYQGEKAK